MMQFKRRFLSGIVLFVLFGSYLVVLVNAEPSWVMWSQTYGEENFDVARALVETSDGGYALAGITRPPGAGLDDIWLVKTDANGNMEWNQTYGEENYDVATALVETSDGGYTLAGHTNSFSAGDDDFWLVKTDGSGNIKWSQTYGGANLDEVNSLVEASDGGYAIAGFTNSSGAGNLDFWLVKTDGSGNMEWNQTYGGAETDIAYSLVETSDGGYALTGRTSSFGAGFEDFWLVKTDGSGNIEWSRTYGGANHEGAKSLVETSDGGYALAGQTSSFGTGSNDFWLVRTNEQGIPEFPSWIIMPLLFVTTLMVIICKKRLPKNPSNI